MTFRLFSVDIHSDPQCIEQYLELNDAGVHVSFDWGPTTTKNISPDLQEASRLFLFCMQYVNKLLDLGMTDKLKDFQLECELLDKPLEA